MAATTSRSPSAATPTFASCSTTRRSASASNCSRRAARTTRPPTRRSSRRRLAGSDDFYFVTDDHFANGGTANDEGGLEGDRLVTGFDPTDKGFYNGGDLQGLRDRLDYIDGLGTTAIWLTPSFKNRPVQGKGANVSAGYHGYWITDFTQIDPHLGERQALIAEAHAKGIKVYFDIITNHTADVIIRAAVLVHRSGDGPYTDAAGAEFDPAEYAGTGNFPRFRRRHELPYTPTVAPEDADLKVPAWLNDARRCTTTAATRRGRASRSRTATSSASTTS